MTSLYLAVFFTRFLLNSVVRGVERYNCWVGVLPTYSPLHWPTLFSVLVVQSSSKPSNDPSVERGSYPPPLWRVCFSIKFSFFCFLNPPFCCFFLEKYYFSLFCLVFGLPLEQSFFLSLYILTGNGTIPSGKKIKEKELFTNKRTCILNLLCYQILFLPFIVAITNG